MRTTHPISTPKRFSRERFAILLTLGASALALSVTPALAQAAEQSPAPAANPEPSAAPAGEIVVTANKREQRVRDVGIAISVLSSKDLRSFNITNATDVVRAIPNLHFNAYSSSQVVFNIRGVSQNDYGDQQEPPIAVYQDDSYSSSITSASFPVFDLNRVEALRGPQGTLFGRNATGGAVQFISNQPTDRFGGYLMGQYGRFNQTIIEGALSGPLGDGWSARIAGQYDRDDGYIKDIMPGQPNRGADNHWALRGILKYSQTPDFTAKLTLRYMEGDHERQAGLYSLGPACYSPESHNQGYFLAANQMCSAWSGYNLGVPGSTANGYTNPATTISQGGTPWKTAGIGPAYVNRSIFGSTLRIDANLGGISLTSISDYVHLSKYYLESGDGVPELPYVPGPAITPATGLCAAPNQTMTCYASGTVFSQGSNTDQYSQEIHASTHIGNNYLTVGAFGMIINGNFNAKYATPFDQYDPSVLIHQRTNSYAFFAQDEWKINDKFKLIGGLRFWDDHKYGNYDASEAFSGFAMHFGPNNIWYNGNVADGYAGPAAWNYAGGQTSAVTATPAAARPNFSGLTARAELDYKPNRDTLIYLSYNRGSKSGGFTFSTGTPVLGLPVIDTLNNIPYRPETLDDYEIGLKARFGPKVELNLGAFYYNYHNYQAFEQVGYTQVVHNLPANNHGFEGDLTMRPIPGLTIQASGALQYSHVQNVFLPDGSEAIDSHRLPQAPVFSANALARYEFSLARGRASLQVDALYSGGFCFTVMCAPVEQQGSYHVENARIGFTPAGGNIDIAIFMNNIFNKAYLVYAFDGSQYWGDALDIYAKPRTWGITATYRFGKQ